ncbi:hypothetical protein Tco_0971117 [Tanacetum coccineum]
MLLERSKLCDPSIDLSSVHSIYRLKVLGQIPLSIPRPLVGLAVGTLPASYLKPRVDKYNSCGGGYWGLRNIILRVNRLVVMYRDGGYWWGVEVMDDECAGGGDECAGGAMLLTRHSPAEGGDSEMGGDGDGVVMARRSNHLPLVEGRWKS